MAVAPDAVRLRRVRGRRRRPRVEPGTPVALLAQTTLPHDEWAGIVERAKERFPDLWMPGRSDLCYATTNRQGAVEAVAAALRRGRRHRLGQLLEHRLAGQGRRGCGLPARRARQLRRRAARRPRRHGRRDRRRLGAGVARRRGPRPARAEAGRRGRAHRRGGRVLPSPAGAARPAARRRARRPRSPSECRRIPTRRTSTGRSRRRGCSSALPPGASSRSERSEAERTRAAAPAGDSTRSIDDVALAEFVEAHGDQRLAPVAIVIAAYKERDNIGARRRGHARQDLRPRPSRSSSSSTARTTAPARSCGPPAGSPCIAPVNRGQGAALRLGYRSALERGARFIVTADGDGQTDPADLEVVLEPVVAGTADFVNGSRRLGDTHGTDAVRNLGVVVYGHAHHRAHAAPR